jgi:hypothetical protein
LVELVVAGSKIFGDVAIGFEVADESSWCCVVVVGAETVV